MEFRKGFSYVVGFDKPLIFSVETIREKLTQEGFEVAVLKPCDQIPGLPFAVPSKCDSDWDYLAVVRRVGKTVWVDLPSRVSWVVCAEGCEEDTAVLVVNRQARRGGGVSRRTVHIAAELAGVAVVAPIMWWSSGQVRSKNARYALRGAAVATVAVDLYLLSKYLRE